LTENAALHLPLLSELHGVAGEVGEHLPDLDSIAQNGLRATCAQIDMDVR
jgi:hypothetical protein